MQASLGNVGMNAVTRASTSAPLVRHASDPSVGELTLAQSLARWALTFLAMLAMSGLFAALIANTLH